MSSLVFFLEDDKKELSFECILQFTYSRQDSSVSYQDAPHASNVCTATTAHGLLTANLRLIAFSLYEITVLNYRSRACI